MNIIQLIYKNIQFYNKKFSSSGDQKPLKKTGRNRKARRVGNFKSNQKMNIKTINTIVIAVMTAFLMIACGGSGNSDKKKSGDFPLEVDKTIGGAFSESFEVTNAVLKISEQSFGTKLGE